MKTLYKLHFGCGRYDTLDGLFVADDADVNELVKSRREISFGEALGKHSDVGGPLDESDFTLVTQDTDFIEKCLKFHILIGPNPISEDRDQNQ